MILHLLFLNFSEYFHIYGQHNESDEERTDLRKVWELVLNMSWGYNRHLMIGVLNQQADFYISDLEVSVSGGLVYLDG